MDVAQARKDRTGQDFCWHWDAIERGREGTAFQDIYQNQLAELLDRELCQVLNQLLHHACGVAH